MEEEIAQKRSNNSEYDTSWRSTTNWIIADGSLVNSVIFESSCSPTAVEDDDQNTGNNLEVKYPLILYHNSSDPTPCEITITFAQQHAVRQVYVRSTARVYEIYYASDLRSSNEYLCTVRCGIATRDEEVLCTPSIEEAAAHLTEVSKALDQKKNKSDSNLNADEDGWIEVKAVDSPQLDNGSSPLPSNFNAKHGENIQDLYEATAEINDADPCTSVTLRMLSLQNKGCIFIDEIYVFGDPVEPSDLEKKVGQMEPANSSLVAMFMPALMQLSKTRRQLGCDHTFDTKEKQKSHEIGSKATDSINVANKMLQGGDSGLVDELEEKLHETVGADAIPAGAESKMPPQVSDTLCLPNVPDGRIEKVLDQLVSRVSRMEDLFLRFEEHMLKPINSIDYRLQRVEQQLEELTKKPWNSEFRCCDRISAPEFSWHESGENLFNNNENNEAESHKKDYTVSILADDLAELVNDSQSHSNLLVTDPLSPNAKEENNVLEAGRGFTSDKPKHALSVDVALASALAGFLSSTSPELAKYTQALAIKAPDFSAEEDSGGKQGSSEVECGRATGSPICLNTEDDTECNNDSPLEIRIIDDHDYEKAGEGFDLHQPSEEPKDDFPLENAVEVIKPIDDHNYENAGEVARDIHQHNEEGKNDSLDWDIHHTVAPSGHEVVTEDVKSIEGGDEMNNTSVDDKFKPGSQFLEIQANGFDATEEGSILNSKSGSNAEVAKEPSNKDVLQVLKLLHSSSVVDFKTPVLDVKFVSQENSNTTSPFETLWDDIPESKVKAPCAKENDDNSLIGEQQNLIMVEDLEPTSPANGNCFSVDMNYCSLTETPLYVEGEKLPDYYTSNSKEACAASLI